MANYTLPVHVDQTGMRVRVYDGKSMKPLGPGTIVSYEEIVLFGHNCSTPVISLDSGDRVRGCETWWTPIEETKEIKP